MEGGKMQTDIRCFLGQNTVSASPDPPDPGPTSTTSTPPTVSGDIFIFNWKNLPSEDRNMLTTGSQPASTTVKPSSKRPSYNWIGIPNEVILKTAREKGYTGPETTGDKILLAMFQLVRDEFCCNQVGVDLGKQCGGDFNTEVSTTRQFKCTECARKITWAQGDARSIAHKVWNLASARIPPLKEKLDLITAEQLQEARMEDIGRLLGWEVPQRKSSQKQKRRRTEAEKIDAPLAEKMDQMSRSEIVKLVLKMQDEILTLKQTVERQAAEQVATQPVTQTTPAAAVQIEQQPVGSAVSVQTVLQPVTADAVQTGQQPADNATPVQSVTQPVKTTTAVTAKSRPQPPPKQ